MPAGGSRGEGPDAEEPFIDLDTMLDWTAAAEVDGVRFDGVDLFLSAPHVDIDSSGDDLKRIGREGPSVGPWSSEAWWPLSGRPPAADRPWETRLNGDGS